MNVSSAAAVQASLAALRSHPDPHMLDIVQLLATKPMQASFHMEDSNILPTASLLLSSSHSLCYQACVCDIAAVIVQCYW